MNEKKLKQLNLLKRELELAKRKEPKKHLFNKKVSKFLGSPERSDIGKIFMQNDRVKSLLLDSMYPTRATFMDRWLSYKNRSVKEIEKDIKYYPLPKVTASHISADNSYLAHSENILLLPAYMYYEPQRGLKLLSALQIRPGSYEAWKNNISKYLPKAAFAHIPRRVIIDKNPSRFSPVSHFEISEVQNQHPMHEYPQPGRCFHMNIVLSEAMYEKLLLILDPGFIENLPKHSSDYPETKRDHLLCLPVPDILQPRNDIDINSDEAFLRFSQAHLSELAVVRFDTKQSENIILDSFHILRETW